MQTTQIAVENARLVRQYLSWFDSKGRSTLTSYDYATFLGRWLEQLGNKPLARATLGDLQKFLDRPRGGRAQGGRGAPATRAKEATVLRAMYGFLLRAGEIDADPTALLVVPTVHNQAPKALADDVWLKLWESDLSDEARVALGLGYFLGLRAGEIVGLEPATVYVTARQMVNFKRKGGGGHVLQYGSVFDVLESLLPHVLGSGGSATFLGPFERMVVDRLGQPALLPWAYDGPKLSPALPKGRNDPLYLNRRLKSWLRKAGMATDTFSPHALRHSAATNLVVRARVPVEQARVILNHASIATTQRYLDVSGDSLGDWLRSVQAERGHRHGGAQSA